jgi:hypothetical protein
MTNLIQDLPSEIATGLLSNLLWFILAALSGWALFWARRRLVWWFVGSTRKLLIFSLVLGGFLSVLVRLGLISLNGAAYALSIGSLALSYYLLRRFQGLGIIDAFGSTEGGINFNASLKKPNHSFDFLGVGAHKLTSDGEFRLMVKRCARGGRPVRLLLSHPDNPVLKNVASRSGIDRDTYALRVRESLRLIAQLANREGFNIEVKFYRAESDADYQQFRLVFIDDRICIMSYTIWDEKEGRSNPQLVLYAGKDQSSMKSLYYTFKDHFERTWVDPSSQPVDLSRYQ